MGPMRVCYILFSLLLVGSCKTLEVEPQTEMVSQDFGDMTFSMRFVPEKELVDRYGVERNPYYRFPGKLPRRFFFVYELEINSRETELLIDLKSISMELESGASFSPRSPRQMENDWRPYGSRPEYNTRMGKMKASAAPEKIAVSPKKPYKGNIVFLIPLTEGFFENLFTPNRITRPSEAILTLPVETAQGDKGLIDFVLPLTPLGEEVQGESGTLAKEPRF